MLAYLRKGETFADLAAGFAVGTAAAGDTWKRPAGLPVRLDAAAVSALLDSCDRRCETGGRDYAVLMLLKRYGARPVGVCRLELTDVRWRSGELVVRGKGGRAEALPLMHDAGEAVASYLQIRRTPPPGIQAVFLAAGAPPRPVCPQAAQERRDHRYLCAGRSGGAGPAGAAPPTSISWPKTGPISSAQRASQPGPSRGSSWSCSHGSASKSHDPPLPCSDIQNALQVSPPRPFLVFF